MDVAQPQPQSQPQPPTQVAGASFLSTFSKNQKNVVIAVLAAIVLILGGAFAYQLLAKSPSQVVSSFIKASQSRSKVDTSIFLDRQAEQNFAIVYKIPPKSFKITKTTIAQKSATVEVEWVAIDSSNGYRERKDVVSFGLRKDGRSWKLETVKQGSVVNFDFLFGN